MPGSRAHGPSDASTRKATLKQRAAEARARALTTKAWTRHVTDAAAGTTWRVKSAWLEEASGTFCADLTHACTGKVRTLRCDAMDSLEACKALIVSGT